MLPTPMSGRQKEVNRVVEFLETINGKDFSYKKGKRYVSITGLLYADPPYNSREYLPNYHVMKTIARCDSPIIKGVTGIREYTEQKSAFCKKQLFMTHL